jgi:hypothetical protein
MMDQDTCCQKQAFKDRRSSQEMLLPNANNRQVPGGPVKTTDAIQELGQEMTPMALRKLA